VWRSVAFGAALFSASFIVRAAQHVLAPPLDFTLERRCRRLSARGSGESLGRLLALYGKALA